LKAARARLLAWYHDHRRDLPWRRTRDPYAIWVSEIMCQQTRVETVVPYFERFLARFPTAGSLAEAPEDDVLALWSGLGYYRRARLLHRGVKEVVERYGGEVPRDAEARLGLPGVGRYTAGAIGSIAFGREEAIVDGNVSRVLARVHGIDTPLGQRETNDALWARAAEWVRGERPGDLNQAVMELGATVCTPKTWRCRECPLADDCVAFAEDRQAELPVPKKRKAPRPVDASAVVRVKGGAVYLAKSDAGLFRGLWQVPMAEGRGRATARSAIGRVGARLAASPVASIVHVLSHRRLSIDVWKATGGRDAGGGRWVSPRELDGLGVSKLTRRILAAVVDVPGEAPPNLRLPGVE
jgi:A/G-specific adenine glycosylase